MIKQEIIITGRVFSSKHLVGYKAWILDNRNLYYIFIDKSKLLHYFDTYNVLNCVLDKSAMVVRSKIKVPIAYYPRYDKTLKLIKLYQYTDSNIIALTLHKPFETISILVCGALVCGAITDPLSKRAQKHADMYYEEIRKRTTDAQAIAKNTNYTVKEISKIKNYLFYEQHDLEDGYRRFDPSFEIATSWQRLIDNKILPHDLTLLKHELMEMELVSNGMTQNSAHNFAEHRYNYGKESNEYYDKIRKHRKNRKHH